MERTLAIIKPDAVGRGLAGRIISRIETEGFDIRAMRMVRLSKTEAEGFYYVHRERPFFAKLFGTVCTPENPMGSCMVSSEGACAAHYTYGRFKDIEVHAA